MRKRIRNTQNNIRLKDEYLTVTQLSNYLGLSKQTIYNKVNLRELPYRKWAGRLYFNRIEVLDEIERAIPNEQ
jgi:excisionase family DNA binding protein